MGTTGNEEDLGQMKEHVVPVERIESNLRHLRAMAQLVLGSQSEADEALKEAWLRLSRSDARGSEDVMERLTALVASGCLERLRLRESQPGRADAA
jgi:RNA polymerase sigma-70 factor (ECF subfamily)